MIRNLTITEQIRLNIKITIIKLIIIKITLINLKTYTTNIIFHYLQKIILIALTIKAIILILNQNPNQNLIILIISTKIIIHTFSQVRTKVPTARLAGTGLVI